MIEGFFICGAIVLFAHLGKETRLSPVLWGIISVIVYLIGGSISFGLGMPSLIGGVISQAVLYLALTAYWVLSPRKAAVDLQKPDDYVYIK